MKILGIVLVVLGALALAYGGINYNRNRTVLDMGSMSVTATEHRNFPIPVVAGVLVLAGGGTLLVVGQRRSSPA
jgi:uncharacterized membrane protein YidH (DUF202 family)